MIRILLIEDDDLIANIIKHYLYQEDGYEVIHAKNAGEALYMARNHFDIILLDIVLPDADGITICKRLREWHSCPIIFISCLDDSDTVVQALQVGGDDYLTKPFDNKILVARIQANLRRSAISLSPNPDNRLSCDGFTLNADTHEVEKNGDRYKLAVKEFEVLLFFMEHPNLYFRSEELYKKIWGKESYGDVRTVLVHIHNIRRKIEEDYANPKYLVNDWGRGYAFYPKGI